MGSNQSKEDSTDSSLYQYDFIFTTDTLYNTKYYTKIHNIIRDRLKKPHGIAYPFLFFSIINDFLYRPSIIEQTLLLDYIYICIFLNCHLVHSDSRQELLLWYVVDFHLNLSHNFYNLNSFV